MERKVKTKRQSNVRKLAPLPLAILFVCGTANAIPKKAGEDIPLSPFAYLALNLQNATNSAVKANVPPNIMLMIDDSGSMNSAMSVQCQSGKYYTDFGDQWRNPDGLSFYRRFDYAGGGYEYIRAYTDEDYLGNPKCATCNYGEDYVFYDPNASDDRKILKSCAGYRDVQYNGYWYKQYKTNWSPVGLENAVRYEDFKISALKKALNKVLTDLEAEQDKKPAFWSMETLHDSEYRKKYSDLYRKGNNGYYYRYFTRTIIDRDDVTSANHDSHAFTADYDEVKSWLNAVSPLNGTPSTRRYLDAVNYLARNIEYPCQKNYIVVLSDGDATTEKNSWYRGVPFKLNGEGGIFDTPSYSYTYNGGGEDNGIAFFSKKLAEKDIKKGTSYITRKTGELDSNGNFITKSEEVNWDEVLKDEVGTPFVDDDTKEKYFKNQHIFTYTIGFGEGLSATGKNYLKSAAQVSKGSSDSGYYAASNGPELKKAFDEILKKAVGSAYEPPKIKGFSTSSPAAAPATSFPSMAALLELDTKTWSSLLTFAKLDKNGNVLHDAAGNVIYLYASYPTSRRVVVNFGQDSNRKEKTSFMVGDGSPSADFYGFVGAKQKEEFSKYFLPWYLRKNETDQNIQDLANEELSEETRKVQDYRIRTLDADDPNRMMADVMGAPVLALGMDKTINRQKYVLTAANDGMVYIFQAQNNENKPYYLALNYLPGAMQRQSKDDSDTVAKSLAATAEKGYGSALKEEQALVNHQPHLYLNSGGMAWRETSDDANGNSATYVAGAMGQGARGAYVLAIAGKERKRNGVAHANNIGMDAAGANNASWEKWASSVPLWETTKGQTNALGYTLSTPQFAQIATISKETDGNVNGEDVKILEPDVNDGVRQYLFLANGYSASDHNIPYDDTPTLYVYDALGQELGLQPTEEIVSGAKQGSLVTKISVEKETEDGDLGGLSTPVLVDVNDDNLADYAYAGDQAGNVYRFTLIGKPSDWKVRRIYQGEFVQVDPGNGGAIERRYTQPITAKPSVYPVSRNKLIVIVGTGSDVYQKDLEDKNQQVMLGLFDDLLAPNDTPVTKQSDLTVNTLKDNKIGDMHYREIVPDGAHSTPDVQNSASKGWALKLSAPGHLDGERVVTKAALLTSTAFFTTRVYETSTTAADDESDKKRFACEVNLTEVTSSAHSWLYAINVRTGLLPSAAGFHGPSDNAIGTKLGGGLASAATISSMQNIIDNGQSSINGYGEYMESGKDKAPVGGSGSNKDEKKIPECVLYPDNNLYYVDEKKGLVVVDIDVDICVARLIRASTREIREVN